jgi:hypothetical protein
MSSTSEAVLHPRSRRIPYLALAAGAIVAGIIVHFVELGLGGTFRDILGDALWGAMILWLVSALRPDARFWVRALVAFVICAAVELSQLLLAPAIDAFRQTTYTHLVFGSSFDPRDFLAYALGVLAAALVARAIFATKRR